MGYPYPYPLGLPKGTVRSTITLSLSITLTVLILRQKDAADQLASLVIVAITFYFGGKMRASTQIAPSIEASERAFGLPAGSIRTILITIFGATALYIILGRPNDINSIGSNYDFKSFPVYFLEILYTILGYTFGQIYNKIRRALGIRKDDKIGILDHLKSLGFLTLTGLTIFYALTVPEKAITEFLIFTTTIALGFYFSVRQN